MPKGRRPLPVEVKKRKGTLRPHREAKTPPPRVKGIPDPPLPLSETARQFWNQICELLRDRGQLSHDSKFSLLALANCCAEWAELRKDIEKNGRFQTIKTKTGDKMERVRPALAAFQDCDRRLRAWFVEFGLTDASHGKVNVDPRRLPSPQREGDEGDGESARPEAPQANPLTRYGLN